MRAHRRHGAVGVPGPQGTHQLAVVRLILALPFRRGGPAFEVTPELAVASLVDERIQAGEQRTVARGHDGAVQGEVPQLEFVRQLAANGAAVLIVEQRAKAVLAISDRTYVLGGGELRMEGTPAELSASPDFVESFLGGGHGRPVTSGEG